MTAGTCPSGLRAPSPTPRAAEWLGWARDLEGAGAVPEAIERYQSAIVEAEREHEDTVLVEALRRLAVLRHHQGNSQEARALCHRSYQLACKIGNDLLAAEALNTMGGLDLTSGSLEDARNRFVQALELGGWSQKLRARAEQNLGILANIQGDLDQAVTRYGRSLEAYRESGDQHGCAIALNNLGMVSADRGQLDQAQRYFGESRALARDVQLRGLCLVNLAEVDVARQRYENARQNAEEALALFDQLGAQGAKSEAYRVMGMMYREINRPALAESRLRTAIDLATATGSVLAEAEASRELALLYQTMGRNRAALQLLNVAYRLFRRLDARADLVYVGGKVAELEGTYLAVVRSWGQSIESSDSHTFGHCERVARNAVAMARALRLDQHEETTILLGAYLHDVGKVRVPPEILNKAGPLTPEEHDVLRMHPVWGSELLADIEFPWDIKPIIRWHHENYDGTGYPDRLKGDEIPLSAQIVGVLDRYDTLTSTGAEHPGLSVSDALEEMARSRHWWSERVFTAFLGVVAPLGGC